VVSSSPVGLWGDMVAGWHWASGLRLSLLGGGLFLDVPLSAVVPATVSSTNVSGAWLILVVAGRSGTSLIGSSMQQCAAALFSQ
jgi:hypothetical protein